MANHSPRPDPTLLTPAETELIDWQSDSTRAQTTEYKIQSRVNAELSRIRDAQSKELSDLTSSLTTNPSSAKASAKKNTTPERDPNTLAAHLSSPFYQDHSAAAKAVEPVEKPPADSGRS